jgi:hypothetical protein
MASGERVGLAREHTVPIRAIRFVCGQIAGPLATIKPQTSLQKNDSACASDGNVGRRLRKYFYVYFSSASSII